MSEAAAAPNAEQIDYWNTQSGPAWAALQDKLDAQLEPLGLAAIEALKPAPGERIIDVGCGCGATTLALADRVGPGGSVVGADLSRPMLEVARRRARGCAQFLEADAQVHPFETGAFDGVYSRFGVMFFADPVAAFANLRRATRPGGRLAFVCWRSPAENPVMILPMMAVIARFGGTAGPAPEPLAPGPFAFADESRVRPVLEKAGWGEVTFTPHDEKIGAASLGDAVELAVRIGPLGAQLRDKPEMREPAVATVREGLEPHMTAAGLRLDSATWIVQARA